MRNLRRFASLALGVGLFAAPAFAKDDIHCDITADKGDRVAKGKDVVIEENARVENAIAVEGNVVIRKGASVKNAIALRGNVMVEQGARVRESAITVDGKVQAVDPKSIKGSTVALGKGLQIRTDDGHEASFNLQIDGMDLGQTLAKELLKDVRQCKVVEK